ncbi:nitrate- and nitrite sensing domain-containing protein [Streptomyces viridochromogenes]|uniref:histidine kinase n=1 Tax=Streptomyces viridochromogenes Tue57 TaxID=1160705 RepID=L8PIT9_STRVR|nr:nitrate- and nitrite sensing domain-containing protein [Streptomyces viridochromogenes]ELS57461.1 putative Large secreted protein [Streptomyces viridochromogenes Tue57]
MSPRTGPRRRLGSIRLSLILLALVPSVTLAAVWSVTTIQMFSEGLGLRSQTGLSRSTGAMGTEATLALQQERSYSAVWLATRQEGARTALDAQRRRTDRAVAKLLAQSEEIQQAPSRVKDRLYSVVASVSSLEYYRGQVDDPTDITAVQALGQYTSIIDDQIHAFQELSQVDDGDLTSQAGPLVALEHAAELMSQEDALLTLAAPSRRMDEKTWTEFAELVNTRRWLVEDQILPSLTGSAKTQTERILRSPQWGTLESVEDKVLAARAAARDHGDIAVPDAQKEWRAALIEVSDAYTALIRQQTAELLHRSAEEARGLLIKAASLSAGGLVALLLCVGMSWRITRSLSRRLRGLREATLSLAQERLPDVVARLERGEKVDVELATPPLDYGHDELGQVAEAFNTAQRTAVHTAVELADTRRGFQKVILGIARQSQNLVNLQLTKLDALERAHQDPEVLKGLYELDSTASQLRRYEENLVIISGERPGRSWSEPVALIDILRSAVGEVAEYQRVEVHTEEEVHLAPPAVADVIHLLAELIENATLYSPAPAPVGVRAAMVAKGLAVEIEDRGLGMSEEDYASFNAQLADPPQFDVVALADDLRLGMFVIGQLAHRHGIAVTLRSSPYGGTTAIVLIPHDIVVRDVPVPDREEGEHAGAAEPQEPVREPRPVVPARTASDTAPARAVRRAGLSPLPRRVPQTSLAAELREEAPPAEQAEVSDDFTAERAAASLACFQRGTLQARDDNGADTPSTLGPADPTTHARLQRATLQSDNDNGDQTPNALGPTDHRDPTTHARLQRDTPQADGGTVDGTPSSTSEVPDEPVSVVLGVSDGGAREESHSVDAAASSPKSSTPSADRS